MFFFIENFFYKAETSRGYRINYPQNEGIDFIWNISRDNLLREGLWEILSNDSLFK